jgi:hypothetical protein
MKSEIKLTQLPVISHDLIKVGASVTARIKALNLDKLIATEDTVKVLKATRAELNKELKDFEEQRKAVKEAVNKPYNDFEVVYKAEISDKYTNAVSTLKDKVETVESKVKAEKKAVVVAYFNELCQSEKIDFIPFEKLGLEINLSTTEKAYKERVNDYITKVIDDLLLIKANEFEAEIMVEYKASLNVSQSITKVVARKEAEKVEAERIRQQAIANRKAALLKLGMIYDEFTKSYLFNQVAVTVDEIETLIKDEFTTLFIKTEGEIKVLLEAERVRKEAEKWQSEIKQVDKLPEGVLPVEMEDGQNNLIFPPIPTGNGIYGAAYIAEKPIEKPVTAPILSAPVTVEPKKLLLVEFQVTASRPKLELLKQFLITNEITYKNI